VPLLVGFAVLYLALAPAVVNGDGLGYLRAALGGGVYPGHLGYLPLLRLLPGARPVDLLVPARLLSVVSGVGALLLFAAAARRLGSRAWLPAAAGLGCSYAVVASSSDVESYAPALACVCAVIYFLSRRWTGAAALAAALAALIHVENLLLVVPLFFVSRRWALLPLVVVGGAYLWAGVTPLGATHGFSYPLHLWTPFVAVYGAAKALVYSPYPYEASWARVLGGFVVGAAALGYLLWQAWPGGAPLGRTVTLAWIIAYTAMGVTFFPSDHERWTFLLPILWLSVAAAGRTRAATAAVAALLAANLLLWAPRARDDGWRKKAEAATAHLRAGDLVVSPGHGWDEYVGFWDGPEVRRFPLAYYAGELGSKAAVEARLMREMASAPRIIYVRMHEPDVMGWKELRLFGIFQAGFPSAGEPLGDGVYRMGATPSTN
jgi:hypothetical protein